MQSIKKGMSLAVLVSCLAMTPGAQAKSIFNKMKDSLKKSSSKVQKAWNGLSPGSKAAIIAGVATAGTAAAGAGYALSSDGASLDSIWSSMSSDDQKGLLKEVGGMTAEEFGTPFKAEF